MSIHKTLAVGVLAAAAIPAGAFAARIDQVFVTNKGAAEAMPAEVLNRPTVTIAGTPEVALKAGSLPAAPRPFQKHFVLDVPGGIAKCDTVEAPAGEVVTVQQVVASIDSVEADGVTVELNYLPGVGNGNRDIRTLIPGAGAPSAKEDLLLHLGLGDPKLRLHVCALNRSAFDRKVDVVASGTRQPL